MALLRIERLSVLFRGIQHHGTREIPTTASETKDHCVGANQRMVNSPAQTGSIYICFKNYLYK